MKKIIFIVLCLFTINTTKAGNGDKLTVKKRRLTFTASVGTNIALGDYGKKDSVPVHDTSHLHGFSDLGFYFDISAGYQITDVIGVMAMLNANFDDFNTVAYQNAYAYNPSNPFAENEVTTSGSYHLIQYLIGPYFEIPCTRNKLSKICIKTLVGSMHANYPTLSSADGYSQSIASGSGFSYRICVGYESYVSDAVCLSFNVAYGGATITYPSVTASVNGSFYMPNQSYTSNSPRTMSVGLLQISTGVVVLL